MDRVFFPGAEYRIQRIRSGTDAAYRQKLIAMGLLPGATFQVVRLAPLGDPIQLDVHGYSLCVRAKDLRCLKVEEVSA